MARESNPYSLDATGIVELAVVERGGMIESRHLGAAVVVGAGGAVLDSLGNPDALVYPRSSLKPLQALTVLECGVDIDGEALVLATASHSGTEQHVAVVRRMLESVGLGEDALHCPPDWPLDSGAQAQARVGGERRRVTMNCSGKHASFLMACVANGWSIDDYLDPLHPLQLRVHETVERFAGESIGHSATDGCGAPVFALSLSGLARGISHVGLGADEHTARLTSAIRRHPWAIAGEGTPNTVVIRELGLVAKVGAEGVMVMAASDGTAVAVKCVDGSSRATTLVALELLARAGAVGRDDADRVIALTTERVLGGGEPVGGIRTAF